MKLIKITDDHYVVVDDSDIKEGDWYIDDAKQIRKSVVSDEVYWQHRQYNREYMKITHSTRPFEKEKITNPTTQIVREAMEIASKDVRAPKVVRDGLVKPSVELLPLQEVKELIGEVDVEKKAEEEYREFPNNPKEHPEWHYNKDVNCFRKRKAFIKGYNQALEDNKEKKYTEDDLWKAVNCAYVSDGTWQECVDFVKEQVLQPKTEWEVEIVDGKLKLK